MKWLSKEVISEPSPKAYNDGNDIHAGTFFAQPAFVHAGGVVWGRSWAPTPTVSLTLLEMTINTPVSSTDL